MLARLRVTFTATVVLALTVALAGPAGAVKPVRPPTPPPTIDAVVVTAETPAASAGWSQPIAIATTVSGVSASAELRYTVTFTTPAGPRTESSWIVVRFGGVTQTVDYGWCTQADDTAVQVRVDLSTVKGPKRTLVDTFTTPVLELPDPWVVGPLVS